MPAHPTSSKRVVATISATVEPKEMILLWQHFRLRWLGQIVVHSRHGRQNCFIAELEAYAHDGRLPDWFPQTGGRNDEPIR